MNHTRQHQLKVNSYRESDVIGLHAVVAPSLQGADLVSSNGSSNSGSHQDPHDDDFDGDTSVIVEHEKKTDHRTKTPPMYQVILVNDDYTPMEFVIHVLQKFFGKDMAEATKIMLQVHQSGAGLCGIFSYEIAETKVYLVNQYARANKHPLKCTMEIATL